MTKPDGSVPLPGQGRSPALLSQSAEQYESTKLNTTPSFTSVTRMLTQKDLLAPAPRPNSSPLSSASIQSPRYSPVSKGATRSIDTLTFSPGLTSSSRGVLSSPLIRSPLTNTSSKSFVHVQDPTFSSSHVLVKEVPAVYFVPSGTVTSLTNLTARHGNGVAVDGTRVAVGGNWVAVGSGVCVAVGSGVSLGTTTWVGVCVGLDKSVAAAIKAPCVSCTLNVSTAWVYNWP